MWYLNFLCYELVVLFWYFILFLWFYIFLVYFYFSFYEMRCKFLFFYCWIWYLVVLCVFWMLVVGGYIFVCKFYCLIWWFDLGRIDFLWLGCWGWGSWFCCIMGNRMGSCGVGFLVRICWGSCESWVFCLGFCCGCWCWGGWFGWCCFLCWIYF